MFFYPLQALVLLCYVFVQSLFLFPYINFYLTYLYTAKCIISICSNQNGLLNTILQHSPPPLMKVVVFHLTLVSGQGTSIMEKVNSVSCPGLLHMGAWAVHITRLSSSFVEAPSVLTGIIPISWLCLHLPSHVFLPQDIKRSHNTNTFLTCRLKTFNPPFHVHIPLQKSYPEKSTFHNPCQPFPSLCDP